MANEPIQRRLQFVMDYYGLRPNQNIILNYFGMANEVFTIPTTTGTFVLKHCFKNNTQPLVENEAALIKHLNSKGVPTPKLVPTKAGDNYLNYEGELYVMTEFMDGYFPTWEDNLTLNMVQQSTKALADYHTAVADFKAPNDTHRIGIFDIAPAKQWLLDLQTQIAAFDEDTVKRRASIGKIQRISEQLLALADDVQNDLDQINLRDLQKLWIHGDMHCFNLIFNTEKTHYIGILDFDFLRYDYRLFDLYWTSRIYNWSYWFKEEFGDKIHDPNFEPPDDVTHRIIGHNLKVMIDTYRHHNALPDTELRHLPLMVKALPLWVVRFFNFSNSEEECLEHCHWFQWKLDSMARIQHAVTDAVSQILTE